MARTRLAAPVKRQSVACCGAETCALGREWIARGLVGWAHKRWRAGRMAQASAAEAARRIHALVKGRRQGALMTELARSANFWLPPRFAGPPPCQCVQVPRIKLPASVQERLERAREEVAPRQRTAAGRQVRHYAARRVDVRHEHEARHVGGRQLVGRRRVGDCEQGVSQLGSHLEGGDLERIGLGRGAERQRRGGRAEATAWGCRFQKVWVAGGRRAGAWAKGGPAAAGSGGAAVAERVAAAAGSAGACMGAVAGMPACRGSRLPPACGPPCPYCGPSPRGPPILKSRSCSAVAVCACGCSVPEGP